MLLREHSEREVNPRATTRVTSRVWPLEFTRVEEASGCGASLKITSESQKMSVDNFRKELKETLK